MNDRFTETFLGLNLSTKYPRIGDELIDTTSLRLNFMKEVVT